MNNEEKFKHTLKSLVESKEFAFEENDWKKGAAYIHNKRVATRVSRFGSLIAVIAILVVSGVLLLLPGSQENTVIAEKKTTQAANQQPQQAIADPALDLNKNPGPEAEKKSLKRKTPHVDKKPAKPSAQTEKIHSGTPAPGVTPDPGSNTPGGMEINFHKNVPQQEKRGSAEPPAVTANTGVNEQKTYTQETKALPVMPDNQLALSTENKKEENPEQATENTETVVSAHTQSHASAPEQKNAGVPDSIKTKLPRTMLLSCEAGASYQYGWTNEGGKKDAGGLNPVAGLHYLNPINDKFVFSFGLQYQRTAHLNAFTHTSKQTRYSFGEESQVTTITPSKLHYLSVPIRTYYKLNEKNTVGVCYSIAYLVDVQAKVDTYSLKAGKHSDLKSYTTRGYTDGFALFDSQVSLFYRRHLYGDLFIHGEIFFGLNDVKQNNFFGGDKAQRNNGLRVMLVYGIFNRNR